MEYIFDHFNINIFGMRPVELNADNIVIKNSTILGFDPSGSVFIHARSSSFFENNI